jgi:hypothetical protein
MKALVSANRHQEEICTAKQTQREYAGTEGANKAI